MEEILNNWLQEKPKDKFDKELHKYTYYDLIEFAEHYQALQLQQTGVMACFSEEQLSQINKYGKHQYNRASMDLSYVSFEFWLK